MRRPPKLTIPILLRMARARLGLNQKEAAELIGIDAASLSRYESGEREPTWESIETLRVGLGLPIELMSFAKGIHTAESPEARDAAASWCLGKPRKRRARA